MVEMMLPEKNKRIFTAKYQTFLPSKDELRKLLEMAENQAERREQSVG